MGGFAEQNIRDDIVFRARVDDQTGKFFDDFDRRLNQLASRTESGFRKIGVGGRESAASIGTLAGVIGGVTASLISMGLKAVASFKRIVVASTMLAARANTLKAALNQVASSAGLTNEELEQYEEKMKASGITTIKTREALMKMIQANLDLSQATKLSRIAQNAAVIAGTNSSIAFGRILHAITTLQPEVLRSLGLIINMQAEIKKYADANNVAALSIDANTKQQIFMNATIAAGERITGSYEAAMDTAGKQAGSLSRHMEELQLALGQVSQPVYTEWIKFQTEELKKLREWFEENKDEVEDFAKTLGFLAKVALDVASALISMAKAIPMLMRKAVPLFALLELLPDIDKRWQELGRTFNIVLAGIAGGFAYITETVRATVRHITNIMALVKDFSKLLMTPIWERGPEWDAAFAGLSDTVEKLNQDASSFWDDIAEKSREATLQASRDLGLIDETADGAADALGNVADSMDAVAAETEDAVSKIQELNEKMGEELAEIEKQRARQAIRDAIDEARRREDIARGHQKRLKNIHKNAAKKRAELTANLAQNEAQLIEDQAKAREEIEEQSAENLIDIEIGYRRRLQDIQRSFERDVAEAARSNDAVAVARLIRQNKVNLDEARISRDRQENDEQKGRTDSLKRLQEEQVEERNMLREEAKARKADLEKDLAEQLRMAKEQRQEDIDNLERSLQRKKEDQALQRKWEEEDRAEKWAVELKGLADHFAELQSIDEVGLKYLLDKHGEFIKDDLTLWDRYYNRRTTVAAQRRYGSAVAEARTYDQDSEDMGFGGSVETDGGEDVGFARGGFGVFNTPRRINVAEEVPELVAAIPLNAIVTNNHNISLDGKIDVTGTGSAGSDADIGSSVMRMLAQFGQQLLARSG